MTKPVVHSTFVIERTYAFAPEKVFAAFADPAKKRRWFAEGEGWEVDSYALDFRVGGWERSRFRFRGSPQPGAPAAGTPISNDTVFQDIVANERIVIAYTMAIGEMRFSASQSTIELVPVSGGTKLVFTEQAAFFEGADGPEMRKQGTEQLLGQLEKELSGP